MVMQPRDRRLVTEKNLDEYTTGRLEPVHARVDSTNSRLENIEAMAGLQPGEITDEQTANLLQQPGSSTRAALGEAVAADLNTEGSSAKAALSAQIQQQAVTGVGVTRIVASTDPLYPLEPGELLILLHDPRPQFFFDFSSYELGTGAPEGWTEPWHANDTSWEIVEDSSVEGGRVLRNNSTSINDRSLLVPNDTRAHAAQYADQEVVVKHQRTGRFDRAVLRATGATGSETGYWAGNNGSAAGAGQYLNGQISTFNAPTTQPMNEWYITRLRVEGGTLMSRHWPASGTEPTEWHVTTEGLEISEPGDVGIIAGEYGRFAWVGFGFDGARAPKGPLS